MGTYYIIANHDKGEYITPHAFGEGAKLGEFAGSGGMHPTLRALVHLLVGKWAGDRISITSDESGRQHEEYKDISANEVWLLDE